MVSWLDRLQQRNRAVGFVIAVIYKYVDDQGGYLAALIAAGVLALGGFVLILRRRHAGGRHEMPDTPGAHEAGSVHVEPDGRLSHE